MGGLDPVNGDPQGYLNGQISKNYSAIANDSVQNQSYKGSAFPLYFGNVLNTFFWKGISLSANITYKLKYYFRKPTISYSRLYNNWGSNADFEKRWQNPGDELITTVPSMPYPSNVNRDNFYAFSEINIERGDHVRLQDIRLSYNWKNNNKKVPFKNIQVYFYASNLNLFIWKASNSRFDPDYPTNLIPPGKTWAGGISINF